MSKIRSTYFMKDFADDDPRSVQAAIEGRDDGSVCSLRALRP